MTTYYNFAALLSDGSVASWGFVNKSSESYIDPSSVSDQLKNDVVKIFSVASGYVALDSAMKNQLLT
jgi:hypothetical protein